LIHPKGFSNYDIVLVSNRVDFEDKRMVSNEKVEEYAHRYGLQHFKILERKIEERSD